MTTALSIQEPMLPGLMPNVEALRLVDSFGVETSYGQTTLSRMPTLVEREIMLKRSQQISDALVPIGSNGKAHAEAAEIIAGLLVGYGYVRNDPRAAQTITVYVKHLETVPLFAIRSACADVKNNLVFDTDPKTGNRIPLSPDREPSTVRLRMIAQKHVDKLSTERWKFERVLRAKKTMNPPSTPQARGRIAAGFENLKKDLAARAAEETIEAEARRAAVAAANLKHQCDNIVAEYHAHGLKPVYSDEAKTMPITISLLFLLGWTIEETPDGPALIRPAHVPRPEQAVDLRPPFAGSFKRPKADYYV